MRKLAFENGHFFTAGGPLFVESTSVAMLYAALVFPHPYCVFVAILSVFPVA